MSTLYQRSMYTLSENLCILVVEDNPSDLLLIEQMLESSHLKIRKVHSASRIDEALELLKEQDINLVLLDLSLPDSFGIDSFKSISDIAQRIPVIILTGLSDSETALEALKQNAQDYLVKGEFNLNLLVKSIEYSIERKKAEEYILASEEKYRQMFYKNPFPMWISDTDTSQILEVNDAAIQKYGYERSEFLKLNLHDIQLSSAEAPHLSLTEAAKEKLWNHRKKSGEVITVESTYYPINYFGRTAIQAQVNDITENIRLAKELGLQKQKLVEAVLNAQEYERKNIGRELHDNINQILTAVKLNLSLAIEQSDYTFVKKSTAYIDTVIEEVRKLSKELILPGNLKEIGLVSSIEELMKEMLQFTKIKWKLSAVGIDTSLITEEQKLAIYRIVQEQLNNIIKHADASLISICLKAEGDGFNLLITDNGQGFDTKKYRDGIGITNIINRAELFNGKVKIDSLPGKGCRLEVMLKSKARFFHNEASNDAVLS